MKLSEILRAGKQRIETLGWCQGDEEAIFGKSGKCCAATAVADRGDGGALTYSNDERNRTLRLLEAVNGIEKGDIALWNDAPERTVADVLAAYDRAIAAAELQEASQ